MTPGQLAERATLGAAMLDPNAAAVVLRRLRPVDFVVPWHQEIFRALRDQYTTGKPTDAHSVGLALIDRVGPTRANLVELTRLLRDTPLRPRPGVYAQMILEAALRREVRGLGLLLRAGALSAVLDGSPRPMLAVAATVEANIDTARRRWRSPDPAVRSATEPRPIGAVVPRFRGPEARLSADRLLQAYPVPTPAQVAEHEAALMAGLVTRPASLGLVRRWLDPAHLTDAGSRAVYTALLELADRGQPIDAVTVAWRSRGDAGAPDPHGLLARIETGFATPVEMLAWSVGADQLRQRAEIAADGLCLASVNPDLDLDAVFTAARTEVAPLRTIAMALAPPGRTQHAVTPIRAPIPRRELPRLEGRAG